MQIRIESRTAKDNLYSAINELKQKGLLDDSQIIEGLDYKSKADYNQTTNYAVIDVNEASNNDIINVLKKNNCDSEQVASVRSKDQ